MWIYRRNCRPLEYRVPESGAYFLIRFATEVYAVSRGPGATKGDRARAKIRSFPSQDERRLRLPDTALRRYAIVKERIAILGV